MARFEDLELPEEIYPHFDEEEPHPLKDEDWLSEVDNHVNTIRWALEDLKRDMGTLMCETKLIKKFHYLKSLLKKYGSHTDECKYLTMGSPPHFGEERKKCTCGWYDLSIKLKTRRW